MAGSSSEWNDAAPKAIRLPPSARPLLSRLLADENSEARERTVHCTPEPVSATTAGLPAHWSLIESEPACAPVDVGVNLISTVQEPPATISLEQLLVSENGPDMLMPRMSRSWVEVFFSVTARAALVVRIICEEKVRLVGVAPAASWT